MRPLLLGSASVGVSLIALSAAPVGAPPAALTINPAESRVEIVVGKAGLLGFAGHAHEVLAPSVGGRVEVDSTDWQHSRVSLELDATTLRVTGKDEPASDVPQVQRVMLSDQVLDVARYPKITFESHRVTVASHHGASGAVVVDGDLTLHGTTRPATIRADVTFGPAGDLSARGAFSLKQTQFGIVPVTAAGGTVRVKDELEVNFVLKASPSHASTGA
jgi:polyisoprenoid-binding protein YceI